MKTIDFPSCTIPSVLDHPVQIEVRLKIFSNNSKQLLEKIPVDVPGIPQWRHRRRSLVDVSEDGVPVTNIFDVLCDNLLPWTSGKEILLRFVSNPWIILCR